MFTPKKMDLHKKVVSSGSMQIHNFAKSIGPPHLMNMLDDFSYFHEPES